MILRLQVVFPESSLYLSTNISQILITLIILCLFQHLLLIVRHPFLFSSLLQFNLPDLCWALMHQPCWHNPSIRLHVSLPLWQLCKRVRISRAVTTLIILVHMPILISKSLIKTRWVLHLLVLHQIESCCWFAVSKFFSGLIASSD